MLNRPPLPCIQPITGIGPVGIAQRPEAAASPPGKVHQPLLLGTHLLGSGIAVNEQDILFSQLWLDLLRQGGTHAALHRRDFELFLRYDAVASELVADGVGHALLRRVRRFGVAPFSRPLDRPGDLPAFLRRDPAIPVSAVIVQRQVVALMQTRGGAKLVAGHGAELLGNRLICAFLSVLLLDLLLQIRQSFRLYGVHFLSAAAELLHHGGRYVLDVPGVVTLAAPALGLVFGFKVVAQLRKLVRQPQVKAMREPLSQIHDRAELDRLPFILGGIVGHVEDDEMDVPVLIGHPVLFGRPRLGVLLGVPQQVAGMAVLLPAAFPDTGSGHRLQVGHPLAPSLPQRLTDARVAALQGGGNTLCRARRHVPSGDAILYQLGGQLLACVRVKPVDQALELLVVGGDPTGQAR